MKAFYILFPLFILSFNTVFGCDFMAMIARDGTVISDFSDPSDATQYDYNSVEDYFEFLKERSVVQADGYGVVYYKENSNEIPYNIENPFDETNQAFYLWGELDNCWYGNDWHQSDGAC